MHSPAEAAHAKFFVSVIIPVLDDAERLRTCLEALAQQTWPHARFEVLVIDNGSRQPPEAIVAGYPFARLLREGRPGSYAARNTGLDAVTGNVVAFTDSDCVPEPNWLEEGVRAVEKHGPFVVVGGRVVLFTPHRGRPSWAEEFELAVGFSQQTYVQERHYSVTANLFTTPHTLRRVGPFNAQLKSSGDKEWGQRAHAAGVELVYEENAVVRHPARSSLALLLKKRARLVGGHLTMARERYPHWVAFGLCLGRACLPPLGRVRRASRGGHGGRPLSAWARTGRVLAIGTSLQVYSVCELIRLQLGGTPRR